MEYMSRQCSNIARVQSSYFDAMTFANVMYRDHKHGKFEAEMVFPERGNERCQSR